MYRLGDTHIRLEAVSMVFPVKPLLGHDGVYGFDVMVGGHQHTVKCTREDEARRQYAALLLALDPPAAVGDKATGTGRGRDEAGTPSRRAPRAGAKPSH
jgi:hypothetical protein